MFASIHSKKCYQYHAASTENKIAEDSTDNLSLFEYISKISLGTHCNLIYPPKIFHIPKLNEIEEWLKTQGSEDPAIKCAQILNICLLLMDHLDVEELSSLLFFIKEIPKSPITPFLRALLQQKYSVQTLLSFLSISIFLSNTGPFYKVELAPKAFLQTFLDPRKALNYLFSIGKSWQLEEEITLMPILFSFRAPYHIQAYFADHHPPTLPGISRGLLQARSPLLNLLGLHCLTSSQDMNFHFLCLLPKILPILSKNDKEEFLKSASQFLGKPLEEVKKELHLTVARSGHTRAAIELCKTQDCLTPSFFLTLLEAIHIHCYLDASRLLAYMRKKGLLEQISPISLCTTITKLLDHIYTSQTSKEMRLGSDLLLVHLSEEMVILLPSLEKQRGMTKRSLWQVKELLRCREFKLARTLVEHLLENELTVRNIARWIDVLEAHLSEADSLSEIYNRLKQFFSKREVQNLLRQSLKLQERLEAFKQKLLEQIVDIEDDVEKFLSWLRSRPTPSLRLEPRFSQLIKTLVEKKSFQKTKEVIEEAIRSSVIPKKLIADALLNTLETLDSIDIEFFNYLFNLLKDPQIWNKKSINCVIKYINSLSLSAIKSQTEAVAAIIPNLFKQLMDEQDPSAAKYVITLHALSIPIQMPVAFWVWLISLMPFNPQQSLKILSIAKQAKLKCQEVQSLELSFAKTWFLFAKDEEQGVCFVENLLSYPGFSENEKQNVLQLFWLSLEYLREGEHAQIHDFSLCPYERALRLIEKAFLFDKAIFFDLLVPFSELLETIQPLSFLQSSHMLLQKKAQTHPAIAHAVHAAVDKLLSQPFSSFAKKRAKTLAEIFIRLPSMFTSLQWKNCLELLCEAGSIEMFNALITAEEHSIFKDQPKDFYRFIEKTIEIVAKLKDAAVKQTYLFQLLELKLHLPITQKVFSAYLDAYYLLIREALNSLVEKETIKNEEICILLCNRLRQLLKKCNKYFPFNEDYLPPHKLLRRLPECLNKGSIVYRAHDDEYPLHTDLLDAIINEDVLLLPCVNIQNKVDHLLIDLTSKLMEYARQKNVWARTYIDKLMPPFINGWHSTILWQSTASLFNTLITLDLSAHVYELAQIFRQLQPAEIDYYKLFLYLIEKKKELIHEVAAIFKAVYKNSDLVDKRTPSLFLSLFNALIEKENFSIPLAWELLYFYKTYIFEAVSIPEVWKSEAKSVSYICRIRLLLKIGCHHYRAPVLSLIDDVGQDLVFLEKTRFIETLLKALSDLIIELVAIEFCSYGLLIDRSFELWSNLNLLKNLNLIKETKLYFLTSYLKRFFFEKEGVLDYDLLLWACYLIRILFLDHPSLKKEVQKFSQSIQKIAERAKGPIDLIPLCRKLTASKNQNSYFDSLFDAGCVFYPYNHPNVPVGSITIKDLLQNGFFDSCKNYLFNAPSLFVHFYLRVYRGQSEQRLEDFLANVSVYDFITKLIFESLQPEKIKNNAKLSTILFSIFNQKIILYHQFIKECVDLDKIEALEKALCHHFYFIINNGLYTVSVINFLELAYLTIPHYAKLFNKDNLPPYFSKKSFSTLLKEIERELLRFEPSCLLYLLACKDAWEKNIESKSNEIGNLIKRLKTSQMSEYLKIVKRLTNL